MSIGRIGKRFSGLVGLARSKTGWVDIPPGAAQDRIRVHLGNNFPLGGMQFATDPILFGRRDRCKIPRL